MKISLKWAQYYSNVDLLPKGGIDDLVKKIGAQLGAVEEVIDMGARYKGIVVAKVVSCEAHPNADKLSLCKIDDGKATKGVQRDKDGHVQVVCGAPNVRMGQLVAWCPPGVVVPSTLDKEPLKLESRNIRGHVSHGMLASTNELGISDDHSGILVVEEKVKPGTPLAKVYELDDFVVDIENKMFTHRPDCFGMLGIAREIAGISGKAFKSPSWYQKASPLSTSHSSLSLEVRNELKDLVPRFMAVAIKDIKVQPSPVWMQSYLSRVGVRPINNIVDITNYYMLLTGQPLHAYDYDKVSGAALIARSAKKGEKLTVLGGKTIDLKPTDIVIADKDRAIGLAGVMGGAETEVNESTKNIILECATFDKYSIHKTAMAHGLFTDAGTRFGKGQSPLQDDKVITKAVSDILRLAGGRVAGDLHDMKASSPKQPAVVVTADFINSRLGLDLSANEMARLLKNVELDAKATGQKLSVTLPFWRMDIHIPEDVIEEVGRLYGYDHLPLELPKRDVSPAAPEPLLTFKAKLREVLAAAGANEALTYSFVHGDLLTKVGQDPRQAYQLANALSPDLQFYRLSLLPSLLTLVHPNIKAGINELALFEINKTHDKTQTDKDKQPIEEERLALVFASDDKHAKASYSGAAYFQAAKYLTRVLSALGIRPVFTPLKEKDYKSPVLSAAMAPFEGARSAYVHTPEGEMLGIIGEFSPSVTSALKLPNFSAGFELNVSQLLKCQNTSSPYVVQPRFPKVEQDICLRVKADVSYQQVADFVWNELVKIQPVAVFSSLTPVDIYQKDPSHKQITLRLTMASYERTLQAEMVNNLLNVVAEAASSKLGAVRV